MPQPKRARKAKPERAPAVPPEPWERQTDETAKAFQAFAHYRDAGVERSMRKTAQAVNKHLTTLTPWAKRHSWQARVAAWDAELDRVARAELENERVDAAKRQARTAQAGLQISSRLSAAVLQAVADDAQALDRLPFREKLQAAAVWARAVPRLVVSERLALGMSSENVAGHDGGPLDPRREAVRRMSDNERTSYLLGELGPDVVDLTAERERRAAGAGTEGNG